MKKILSVFLMSLFLITTLSACSGAKGSKTFINTSGQGSVEITIEYEGNKINIYSIKTVTPLEEGVNENDMKEYLKNIKEYESDIKGYSSNYDVLNGNMNINLSINLNEISKEDLQKTMTDEDINNLKNLKKFEESLKSDGFKEK